MRAENSEIPVPFKKLYPNMDKEFYKKLIKQDLFRNLKVDICEDCYFILDNVNSILKYNFLQKDNKKEVCEIFILVLKTEYTY